MNQDPPVPLSDSEVNYCVNTRRKCRFNKTIDKLPFIIALRILTLSMQNSNPLKEMKSWDVPLFSLTTFTFSLILTKSPRHRNMLMSQLICNIITTLSPGFKCTVKLLLLILRCYLTGDKLIITIFYLLSS